MRTIHLAAAAVLIAGLAAPAFAQDDPHHPESAEAPAADEAPTDTAAGDTATKCLDPMGGMMGMMGGMMQPGMSGSSQMQMMTMMQMMQMMQSMQMMQMRMMQQMQMDAAPGSPAEGGSQ